MHLLLTKFHMYSENIILQVTNTNTWNNPPKGAFWRWFAQRNKGDAYHINANGAKHHREAILVQPMTYHAKAVARGGGQVPTAPRGLLLPFGRLPASPCYGDGMEAC
jgi:hypothetical protein